MNNAEIASVLEEVADVLEIKDENPFRIRAYRNAVRSIEVLTTPLSRMVEEGKPLTSLQGIGKEMANHIKEMVETGTLGYRDQLLAEIPRSLIDLVRLPGVGPKKAKKLWDELQICSVEELEEAAKAGRIAGVAGFGAKTQEKILAGIEQHRQHTSRMLLREAERSVEPLVGYLRAIPEVERLEVAGSYRRKKETIGDIDLLAIATVPGPVMEAFVHYPQVRQVLMSGETRSSVTLGSGLQVDLRVVPPECYGAALVYFTGSKEHNVKLRRRAVEQGLRISEYGVFREPGGDLVTAGREEADVYATVGLPWIPPELREDRGEIEAAAAKALPRLIERQDLRGDLHMHSVWSDGRNTIEEMVEACAARGYEYMVISDHSKALAMTNGLDAYRLREQWKEIAEVQARHPEIRILRSMEVDILADGSLDLEDEMLAGLDLVLVSLHSGLSLPGDQQTERVLRALEHPEVNVFCHPTARIINRRKPVEMDVDLVLRRAAELGVVVELNSSPHRLDLKDDHLRLAKRLGCRVVISTDSHKPTELDLMRCGIEQARRAGLEPGDVINTLPYEDMRKAFERKTPARPRTDVP
ncbi:MAG TPA: DNA polymerase/3'-5' exonuclease PolX [Thermoanaerobaculia bacterium]|jgi:DNA polymerase (family 10)|nr:DNA polymerase/3'-5' exonuclease PolX [Thermoanaerobaculia bacterium]